MHDDTVPSKPAARAGTESTPTGISSDRRAVAGTRLASMPGEGRKRLLEITAGLGLDPDVVRSRGGP
ncbi:hypothetical protein [Amycolatopsis palatopharyngis]|uniref:hypothetical protein n=1 Tax=Amycolatopsis palatopharyngis TaxID=187982 RepID=UPI0013BE9F63|nr:hypothetical protein [Amycolatopsis palatopharyngis]